MSNVKMLIEVDAKTANEIEVECTKRGRSFSDFFLECYREKMVNDIALESQAGLAKEKMGKLRKKV